MLDRVKEPGSAGEPLYLDCVNALHEAIDNGWGELKAMPAIIGGRTPVPLYDAAKNIVSTAFLPPCA